MLQEFGTLPSLIISERQRLPSLSAIYFAVACDQVLYVGLAKNLQSRWQNHHRFPQLDAISKRHEVRLFWLSCTQESLNSLERAYIDYYCPILNQTKVPERRIVPSFQMLTLSLKKLHTRVIGLGVCPANNQELKKVVLGYLAGYSATRSATTTLRKTLASITKKPSSLFRWTEFKRLRDGAHWHTRCNGIEIQLIPWFTEHIMHHVSMCEVIKEERFGGQNGIPLTDMKTMRQDVRAMSFRERLEIARNSEIGRKLFPLECGAQFCPVSGVDILCLTDHQLQGLLLKYSYLKDQYPTMQAIEYDPVPKLEF
jgi:hypothetical protein